MDIVKNYVPNNILNKWWNEQGYEPKSFFKDEDREKISRYVLYVFSNKIVFYYVLTRSFKSIPGIKIDTGNIKDLEDEIYNDFKNATKISGDYETVFENNYADKILFMDNEEFYPISLLIKFLKEYDFTKLSQDLLGNIYDRLISPEERHSNGQYYTPIPVVDLINALTIKNKDARVMDPACGSGTFLTRAFDLKLKLYKEDNKEIRENIMKDLFGSDISAYPVHLATIALASKLLMYNPDVYPNIIKDDFLNLKTSNVIPKLRTESNEKKDILITDLSGKEKIVSFKPIDAFVGNLPYIRKEEINNKEEKREKVERFLKENGFTFGIKKDEEYLYIPDSGADFLIYFWYYLLPFLKEGSMVGFLTSDAWLNVEYGEGFKKFISKYFKIKYIIDSSVERWFEDALVNTVITVLERIDNSEEIKNNKIKFIRINRKINDLIKNIDDAVKIADDLESGVSSEDIKIVREVRQGDIEFNDVMKGKLFQYLRGTDEFFNITNNKNMVPLQTILDITYGIKTGANNFFYVGDITQNISKEELKNVYGLRSGEIKTLSIIKSGDKSTHIIEKEYLKPILKGPKEFTKTGELVLTKEGKKYAVIINEDDKNKIKKYAAEYVDYGETHPPGEPFSKRETCKVRNPWWKLSPQTIPDIVFTALFSSTFMYPKTTYMLDHTLYLGKSKDNINVNPIYAFLNSSISFMYPDLLGRNLGGGAVGFQIYEVESLPVPDPKLSQPYKNKLETIMKTMEARKVGSVFDEIWDLNGNFSLSKVKPDRLELDRTILEILGFENPDKFLESYYVQVVKIVKERMDKAKSLTTNKNTNKRSLSSVADEIIKNINVKNFPEYYISRIIGDVKIIKGNKIAVGNDLDGNFISVDEEKYHYSNKSESKYVYYCALRGMQNIPIPDNIDTVLKDFENDLKDWKNKLNKEINNITSNETYREKLWNLCARKLNYSILIQ